MGMSELNSFIVRVRLISGSFFIASPEHTGAIFYFKFERVVLLERADVAAKVGFGLIGTAFSWAVGGLGLAITVLICLMVFDYITGLMVAYYQKDLSSRIGIKGLMKKTYIILLIGAVYLTERSVLHSSGALGDGIAVAYIILEFLSVVENGGKMGVNIGPLRNVIAALKQKEDDTK